MSTPDKISVVIAITGVIAMLFAAPIVAPVSMPLAVLLVIIAGLYTIGIVGQIYLSYRDPNLLDDLD